MPYSLSGDLGGTKCFLAIHDLDALKDDARVAPLLEDELLCKDYQSMGELINDFLKRWNGETPVVGCIGVAGPVADGRVCITNLDWHESVEELQNATGVGKIKLINDFTATGYGLLAIRPDDYLDFDVRNGTVSTPTVVPDNSTGIVSFAGAGTGFGVGFIANGLAYSAEGGHTTFSPIEAEDHALAKFIREKYDTDHVSFERIVSGLGLRNMHDFFWGSLGGLAGPALREHVLSTNHDIDMAFLAKCAEAGDKYALKIFKKFFYYYGFYLGNMCVLFRPKDYFIAGGILAKDLDLVCGPCREEFCRGLYSKGRMSHLPGGVSFHVLTNQKLGIVGAAYLCTRM